MVAEGLVDERALVGALVGDSPAAWDLAGELPVNLLRKLCRERGLVTLREDGFQKVIKGLTTVDEILRVTENA